MTLLSTPEKSDDYSLEYSVGQETFNDNIHLSNTNDEFRHISVNDILSTGILKFLTNKEIIIKTSKISELKLKRNRISPTIEKRRFSI